MADESLTAALNDNDERFLRLQYKVFESRIEKIFQLLDSEKIDSILIKGWAAAQNYSAPHTRRFVDIDLMVAPEIYEKARSLVENLPEGGYVDLHRGARHLDERSFEDLWDNSLRRKIGKTLIRVLRPEDHLRILCVHWLNDGGADRERLKDLYWAIVNRPPDFDWQRLLDNENPFRRRWIVCALGAACRFLDFKIEDSPISAEVENLPEWFVRAVEAEWASGERLQPLRSVRGDRRAFWRQIKKRLPPNPIQATIETEGDLDGGRRFWYQLKSVFPRLKPYFHKNR